MTCQEHTTRQGAEPGPNGRRRWLSRWPLWGVAWGASLGATAAGANAASAAASPSRVANEERMPGDPLEHRIVYQLNQAEAEHVEHILGSVGAMIGKYAHNVAIVVVAFGPGIHLLARQPKRPVPVALRERAAAQARDYKVRFVACGNTMTTLGCTAADMLPFANVEEVGAAVLMELQEQGFADLAW